MGSTPGSVEMRLQFGILGSLRVMVDGRELALESPKQRSLLGALLIDLGSVVSTDRLALVLWGDDQPHDPSGAVQTHVSRLRALLNGEGVAARSVLVTRAPGYALTVDPQRVDAGRFGQLLDQARAAPSLPATADLLQRALALWRGRPLAELDDELAGAEATRLEELRATAVELRADALLALGRYGTAADELEAAVARHPLRERLHGQLMLALVRSGRRVDALAVYRRLRDMLVEELGVEPSAALRRLERAILQQQEDLPWPVSAEAGGAEARSVEPHHRPEPTSAVPAEPLTSLLGRGADLRGVTAALAAGRVVVLTGVGGVGKSRLAVRVARELADHYPDGVRRCDLVGAEDPEAVSDLVATTLEVWTADVGSSEHALIASLQAQRLLLVLDNCEHVLAGAARLVERVATRCPRVDVLATSRQPLGVPGERIWSVQPLEVGDGEHGDAVELFCDRAEAADPSFALRETDREAVEQICRRLDGLPLAVELAAARVRSMTPADIADRLDDRFQLLVSGSRLASPRHRSLQAVVDWSYAQLADETARLFERLAVFAGRFGIESAEQVCAGEGLPASEVAGRLGELVDHSLVTVDRSGRHGRYRLLETLRAYGRSRLQERGELPTWRRRHAEHFTALAEDAADGLQGAAEARWLRVVDAELANLRTAQAWARSNRRPDLALRLAAGLRIYAYYRLQSEVYDWAARALELPGASGQPAHAAARVTAGVGWMQRGRLAQARVNAEAAAARSDDDAVVLRARRLLAEVALYQGQLEESDRHGRDVIEQARTAGRAYDEALGHLYRVHAAAYAGRTDAARAHLQCGWQVVETVDNPSLRAAYRYLEGEVRLDADPAGALDALPEAIQIARSVRNRFIEGVARVSIVSLQARHGEPNEALAAFPEIIDHWRTSGDWTHMWTTLHNLVILFGRIDAHRSAAVLLEAIETATTGAPAFGADADRLHQAADSVRASLDEDTFAEATARGRSMSDDETVVWALDEIGRLLDARATAG